MSEVVDWDPLLACRALVDQACGTLCHWLVGADHADWVSRSSQLSSTHRCCCSIRNQPCLFFHPGFSICPILYVLSAQPLSDWKPKQLSEARVNPQPLLGRGPTRPRSSVTWREARPAKRPACTCSVYVRRLFPQIWFRIARSATPTTQGSSFIIATHHHHPSDPVL